MHVVAIKCTCCQASAPAVQCLAPTYSGEYHLRGSDLRKKGMNRIGNMVVPNDNYCKFEEWLMPILDSMLEEQKEQGVLWTPQKVPTGRLLSNS